MPRCGANASKPNHATAISLIRVPVGVFITTPQGYVIEANSRFIAMLGFADLESLKRVNISDLWTHPEERVRG